MISVAQGEYSDDMDKKSLARALKVYYDKQYIITNTQSKCVSFVDRAVKLFEITCLTIETYKCRN